jgi:hypothetical protein
MDIMEEIIVSKFKKCMKRCQHFHVVDTANFAVNNDRAKSIQ